MIPHQALSSRKNDSKNKFTTAYANWGMQWNPTRIYTNYIKKAMVMKREHVVVCIQLIQSSFVWGVFVSCVCVFACVVDWELLSDRKAMSIKIEMIFEKENEKNMLKRRVNKDILKHLSLDRDVLLVWARTGVRLEVLLYSGFHGK